MRAVCTSSDLYNHHTPPPPNIYLRHTDCYTVLAWWQYYCQWSMRHSLQLASITLLRLIGLNLGCACFKSQWIMNSHDKWECPPFFLFIIFECSLIVSSHARLGLDRGTVKESNSPWTHGPNLGPISPIIYELMIQNLYKILHANMKYIMITWGHNFAHATTAELSRHVQNCDLIRSLIT